MLQLLLQNKETEAVHVKGREEVSRFLFNWADIIDEQASKPTPVLPVLSPKSKEYTKTAAFNLIGALSFLAVIYSNELVYPNSWKEARFLLMFNMWMSHWCWVDVWRGIQNTKLRTLLTIGSSLAGLTLPAMFIPEMQAGHESTIRLLKEMSLIIAGSHIVAATLFEKVTKQKEEVAIEAPPAEQPAPRTMAVRSRPRDLQVQSQGSRNGHYFYVQFEVPGDSLTKQRFLDVILYEGDAALGKEPELLIVRSNHRPDQIFDEVVRYESERQEGN